MVYLWRRDGLLYLFFFLFFVTSCCKYGTSHVLYPLKYHDRLGNVLFFAWFCNSCTSNNNSFATILQSLPIFCIHNGSIQIYQYSNLPVALSRIFVLIFVCIIVSIAIQTIYFLLISNHQNNFIMEKKLRMFCMMILFVKKNGKVKSFIVMFLLFICLVRFVSSPLFSLFVLACCVTHSFRNWWFLYWTVLTNLFQSFNQFISTLRVKDYQFYLYPFPLIFTLSILHHFHIVFEPVGYYPEMYYPLSCYNYYHIHIPSHTLLDECYSRFVSFCFVFT